MNTSTSISNDNVIEHIKKKAFDRANILTSLDQFYVKEKSKSVAATNNDSNNTSNKYKKSNNSNSNKKMKINDNNKQDSRHINDSTPNLNSNNIDPMTSNINKMNNSQYKCRNIMEFLTFYTHHTINLSYLSLCCKSVGRK